MEYSLADLDKNSSPLLSFFSVRDDYPTFVAPYARRTLRLNEALRLIGLAVGGETGSRLAIALGMSVSPDTIIQRIRQIQLPTLPTPKVLGVDDWAKHKGQRVLAQI